MVGICSMLVRRRLGEPVQPVQSPIGPEHAGDRFPPCLGGVHSRYALDDSRLFHQGGVELRRGYGMSVILNEFRYTLQRILTSCDNRPIVPWKPTLRRRGGC